MLVDNICAMKGPDELSQSQGRLPYKPGVICIKRNAGLNY